jgi:hypothetical protein
MARMRNGNGNGNGGFARKAQSSGFPLGGPPNMAQRSARYNPYGAGPTTPRDEQHRRCAEPDNWDRPRGTPSETPSPHRR